MEQQEEGSTLTGSTLALALVQPGSTLQPNNVTLLDIITAN
jgi:hypothetical protein